MALTEEKNLFLSKISSIEDKYIQAEQIWKLKQNEEQNEFLEKLRKLQSDIEMLTKVEIIY